jgi:hypothetical protein
MGEELTRMSYCLIASKDDFHPMNRGTSQAPALARDELNLILGVAVMYEFSRSTTIGPDELIPNVVKFGVLTGEVELYAGEAVILY